MDRNTGEIINGRYRIAKLLGRGAFGSVYLAHDMVVAQRPVVIKITHEPFDDNESTAFAREADTSAAVKDPNLMGVFDAGITEDGYSYIVREYIEGETLETILKRAGGPLDVVFAARIAIAVAKGLRSLHEEGIIHRDIKPSNVIIPNNPDDAKLTDFGIVGRLESKQGVTESGQIFGTPLYMAPEQLRAEPQSAAADIYGLGVMLYEMIYGIAPFAGKSVSEVIFSILEGQVRFPLVKGVPVSILSLIRRSMSVAPEDRPQSADQVIQELSEFLEPQTEVLDSTSFSVIADQKLHFSANAGQAASVASVNYDVSVPAMARSNVNPLPVTLGAIGIVVIALSIWLLWGVRYQLLGIVIGILLTAGGFALATIVRRWLKGRRSEVEVEAGSLLLSSKSRVNLSTSLAIEVDSLIARVSRLDDRILATSLAIMVKEFQAAKEAQLRQAAIMNVVQLLEKLTNRLSPWYVRHEKLIALAVTAVGILSGVTTVTASIVSMTKAK